MRKTDSEKPDFFEEGAPDPLATVTGGSAARAAPAAKRSRPKRKAGFYLSQRLIDRFNTKFYELKLAGAAVENKSSLLEEALEFALDDLDREADSILLARIQD